ncbi:GPR endopeptidase [Microaerobacter geothermalis]|uniref:GPR endopeptidase n=1 Tax=Microaerobacter geothermalis TaxID=674972 RepID=UPI001F259C3A|nr:GPR endopeptidase [Microaerobacter geothermalis]MCF6092871.1 GPR endopeptidase [Microaerobacter geothermalis]
MSDSLDLRPFSIHTDLALEAHELANAEGTGIPGVRMETEELDEITISKVFVENVEGAKAIGKFPGKYITLEVPGLRKKDSVLQDKVAKTFAKHFQQFLQELRIEKTASVLVVGLGNWNVTPDALGPMVVENLVITRHLFSLMPEKVDDGYRSVSAISPGVMGITGIETSEIVHGVIEKIKPDFVIAIDALAARSLDRVNTTIQIADTGIHPGSGIGNKRKALNKETLGIPVIAIGVPTVVEAATIAYDTIDFLLAHFSHQLDEEGRKNKLIPETLAYMPDKKKIKNYRESGKVHPQAQQVFGMIGTLTPEDKKYLIKEVLSPLGQNLIVTPKEVDDFIEDIANVVANGLNAAFHDAVDMDNVSAYTH